MHRVRKRAARPPTKGGHLEHHPLLSVGDRVMIKGFKQHSSLKRRDASGQKAARASGCIGSSSLQLCSRCSPAVVPVRKRQEPADASGLASLHQFMAAAAGAVIQEVPAGEAGPRSGRRC